MLKFDSESMSYSNLEYDSFNRFGGCFDRVS